MTTIVKRIVRSSPHRDAPQTWSAIVSGVSTQCWPAFQGVINGLGKGTAVGGAQARVIKPRFEGNEFYLRRLAQELTLCCGACMRVSFDGI